MTPRPPTERMTPEPPATSDASVASKSLSKVAVLRAAQYPFIIIFALLVPRMMGPDTYGRYALVVSLIGMIDAFLDPGMAEISARVVPELQQLRNEAGIRTFFSRMLGFKIAVDLLLGLVAVVALRLIFPDVVAPTFLWLIILAVFVGDLGGAAYGLLFGLNRQSLCAARDPLRRAASVSMIIVLFHMFGLKGAIFSVVLVEGLLLVINFAFVRRYVSLRELTPKWPYVAPFLRYGFLFYLSAGATSIWQRLGNTLIGQLRGDFRQIALFDLSNQMFLTATSFTLFVIVSLAPTFTRLRLEGKEGKLIDWSRRILTYNEIGCMAAVAAWLLLGADLIPILIGRQYDGLYANVAVLLCGAFPTVVIQLGLALAIAYAEPIWYFAAVCAGVVSFVVTSLVLIPANGSLGCSIATLVSCICCALVLGLRYRAIMRKSLGPALKSIALGAVLLVPCWLLRGRTDRNALLLLGFLATYGSALFVTRVIVRAEIEQLWTALRHKSA
jgi:O-antigen/teichoic acid export membrane protein